jgi:hypothetical protein
VRRERDEWLVEVNKWAHTDFHRMVNEIFVDATDSEIFYSVLTRHGTFTQRFFHKAIHERVTRQFAKSQIDLQEFQKLLSLASSSVRGYEHEWRVYNKWEAIYRIIDHIFEQVLFHAIRQPDVCRQLDAWYEEFRKSRACTLCGSRFRVVDLPDWVYFGSNGFQSCCFQCPLESPKKHELIELVPAFLNACGFIPRSDASPINYALTSRLSDSQWKEVFIAYAKMGGVEHVKKRFGSWFKALAETEALPEGVLTTARGIRCLAQDGHVCHSLDEQRIDNWLSEHGLAHEREPPYPPHPDLNPTGRRRADWKVQDIFIEYFGLIGDANYEKKMSEKILLAQYSEIDLIALYPADIGNLDKRLGVLLGEQA